eukprot:NODE_2022_length_1006_cov_42.587252_g1648_i0.p4 GENE.NODE_2022_length_1006_cov_42.587252_g1648_i0~~NODE_2022_length_1006_cov_42.587252_g1648_i0.p4  ORF type:complete len:75 (-),score=2.34 NODE_2022_length_1006_cov_42.587252_g1648_i0:573-797(-)
MCGCRDHVSDGRQLCLCQLSQRDVAAGQDESKNNGDFLWSPLQRKKGPLAVCFETSFTIIFWFRVCFGGGNVPF